VVAIDDTLMVLPLMVRNDSGALSSYFFQERIVSVEGIGLLTVDQRALCSTAFVSASA
jgi:hypothetical protein